MSTKTKPRSRAGISGHLNIAAAAAKSVNGNGGGNLMQIISPRVKDRWLGLVRRNYTAETVRATLESSNTASSRLYMQANMFEQMEESWPRLARNLQDIRSDVANMELIVSPYCRKGEKPTASAEEKASFVEDMIWKMRGDTVTGRDGLEDLVFNLLDAYGKGISVIEVVWAQDESPENRGAWYPQGSFWVPPVNYDYPFKPEEAERLMLSPTGYPDTDLMDFPPNKFIVGVFRWRSGRLATKSALLRSLAPWWVYTNFAVEWLMNFGQIFGLPLRWATYDRPTDLAKVSEMLENLGAVGWGAFPAGVNLQLIESGKSSADNPNAYLLNACDTLCDIVINGQTQTTQTSATGNRSLGEVHERVEYRRKLQIVRWTGTMLTTQLAAQICRRNYGDDDECPYITPKLDPPKDQKALVERDKILYVDMKLPVALDVLYDTHSVPRPQPGDELYAPPAPLPMLGPGGQPGQPPGQGADRLKALTDQVNNDAAPADQQSMAAVEALGLDERTETALKGLPEHLRAYYVSEIIKAQETAVQSRRNPHYPGGQPGGGRFMREQTNKAKAAVGEIMNRWPSEGQHRGHRYIKAFGLQDNASEFRAYSYSGMDKEVDKLMRKTKSVEDVPIRTLKTTRCNLDGEKIMAMLNSTADMSNEPIHKTPVVVKRGKKSWLWDGHHRAAMNLALGKEVMKARVLDMDTHGTIAAIEVPGLPL